MLIVMWCFVLHFIADFIFQSREMGQKKSVEFSWLLKHLKIQIIVFMLGMFTFYYVSLCLDELVGNLPLLVLASIAMYKSIMFSLWNALIHGTIDWYIWKGYRLIVWNKLLKKYETKYPDRKEAAPNYAKAEAMSFPYWEDHWFYTTIGLDQLLHALTILLLSWHMFL